MDIRVMTYNIQIGSNSANNPEWDPDRFDLDAVIELVNRYQPDILGLQEVDRFRPRSGYKDQVAYIAGAMGMEWAYSPSYHAEETEMGRGQYGVAVLSRYPIVHGISHSLWRRARLQRGEEGWVNERRSMLEARIDAGGTIIDVYCAHLSTTEDQRSVQIPEMKGIIDQTKGHKILLGDFNTTPDTGELEPFLDGLRDVFGSVPHPPSYPNGSGAEEAIDYVLVSPGITVRRAEVVVDNRGVSDHNPVVCDLVI